MFHVEQAPAAARSPVRRRCEAEAHTASAQRRLDADTTISVDIGAHSSDDGV